MPSLRGVEAGTESRKGVCMKGKGVAACPVTAYVRWEVRRALELAAGEKRGASISSVVSGILEGTMEGTPWMEQARQELKQESEGDCGQVRERS